MSPSTHETAAGPPDEGRLKTAFIVVTWTLIGLGLRIASINTRGLWLDEAITVKQASRTLLRVIQKLATGVHPPLYHITMHFWLKYFGKSEVALRSFSVIIGVIAIPVAYWAGKRIYDRRTGLIAAALIALSPFQIWYSQEARMYTLLFLGGLLSTTFLVLAVRENRKHLWVGYLVFTTMGLFTHYFFLFLMVGQILVYVFGIVWITERDARHAKTAQASWRNPRGLLADVPTLGPWLMVSLAMALFVGFWLANSIFVPAENGPNALVGSVAGSGLGYGQEAPHLALRFNDVAIVVTQMTVGFHSPVVMAAFVSLWPTLIYLVFILMGLIRPVRTWTWVLMLGASGILVMFLLGQWQGQILASRYFMAVAAPAFLLVARLLAKLERRHARPLFVVLIALSLVTWADQSYNPDNAMTHDDRAAFQTIVANYQPGDAVIYVPFYLDPLAAYYLPTSIPQYGMPRYGQFDMLRNTQAEIDEDTARIAASAQRVWVLLSFQDIDPVRNDSQAIRYWMKHNGYTVEKQTSLNQVELMLYVPPEVVVPPSFFTPGASTTATASTSPTAPGAPTTPTAPVDATGTVIAP